jgi:hypothetical protein
MSIETFRSEVDKFLRQTQPGVLAVKGAWGVGKTYAWQHLLEEKREFAVPQNYSYISLFGLSSIADVRLAIVANLQPTESVGQPFSISTFNRRWATYGQKLAARSTQIVQRFRKIPGIPEGLIPSGADLLAPMMMRELLICFDDFERVAAENLQEELLGMISTLKETKSCKIVLILNDAQLPSVKQNGKGEKEGAGNENSYAKYREKVVDVEIKIDPTPDEAAVWGLSANLPNRPLVQECVLQLGIRNVRILKRIDNVVRQISPFLDGMQNAIVPEVIRPAVLFTWGYFGTAEGAPSTDFLTRGRSVVTGMKVADGQEKPTDDEVRWSAIIENYGLGHYNEIDEGLLNVVRQGYLADSGLEEAISKRNNELITGNLLGAHAQAWMLVTGTFADNEPEAVAELTKTFRDAIKILGPNNLQSLVGLLRQLNKNELADQLVEEYVAARSDQIVLFDLQQNPFNADVVDQKIRNAFAAMAEKHAKPNNLRTVLEKIATTNGWTNEDQAILTAATADQLCSLFAEDGNVPVNKLVNACYRVSRSQSPDHQEIAQRARTAVKKLSTKSLINAARARMLRVTPPNPPAQQAPEAHGEIEGAEN